MIRKAFSVLLLLVLAVSMFTCGTVFAEDGDDPEGTVPGGLAVSDLDAESEDDGFIDKISFTITPPADGTVVKVDDDYNQDPVPEVKLPAEVPYSVAYTAWVRLVDVNGERGYELYSNGDDEPCMKAGNTYIARVILVADEEFWFSEDTVVDVPDVTEGEQYDVEGFSVYELTIDVEIPETVPETGDTSSVWMIMLTVCGLLLVPVAYLRKKLQ